jgi:6-phosphogluconolactonase/glucosamine-6-phosphate isomerase/deaminase
VDRHLDVFISISLSATIARRVPRDRIHWFWGDERFVPHDDPASNYRMAYEALFSCIPISKDSGERGSH